MRDALIETPTLDGMLYSGSEIANAGARWFFKDYGLNFFSQGLLVSCKGTGSALHPEPGYRHRDTRDSVSGSNELALKIL